jgi:hypothetical protein
MQNMVKPAGLSPKPDLQVFAVWLGETWKRKSKSDTSSLA